MVYITRSYRCSKCHKRFSDFRAAEQCEIDHIVKESVDAFKTEFDKIVKGGKKG